MLIVLLILLLFAEKYLYAVSRFSLTSRLEPIPDLSYLTVPLIFYSGVNSTIQ